LYLNETQLVFGEGPIGAAIMLVGEQPGDAEDRAGRPFVGPAGHLLDQALHEIGLDRRSVYVTNAVKHFKYEQRGKRRLINNRTATRCSDAAGGLIANWRWSNRNSLLPWVQQPRAS
jgi:uracil-DNA glycosylase family 4